MFPTRTSILILLIALSFLTVAPAASADPVERAGHVAGEVKDCIIIDENHVPPVYTAPC